jgi:diaminohydroxyphosphoribosylaminopyrimidine deaminase/5-amino-6-(5-phosphoribosylamino)uracil reductase
VNVEAAMRLAIELSEQVKGTTYPNPPVGAVILDRDGEIAGVGATEPPGGPHAEVVALRRAGERARGGTAVVTLEPCNHHGRLVRRRRPQPRRGGRIGAAGRGGHPGEPRRADR